MGTLRPISDAQRLVYKMVRTNSGRTDMYNLFEELRSDSLRTRSAPGNAMVLHRVEPDQDCPSVLDLQSGGDRVPITFTWIFDDTVRGGTEEERSKSPKTPKHLRPEVEGSWARSDTASIVPSDTNRWDMNVYSGLRPFQSELLRQLALLLYH